MSQIPLVHDSYDFVPEHRTVYTTPERYRDLITLEEYAKQGRECTKQELKKHSLYTQHVVHFAIVSFYYKLLEALLTKRVLYAAAAVFVAVLAAIVLCTVSSATARNSEARLVPTLTLPQRLVRLHLDFIDWIKELGTRFRSLEGRKQASTANSSTSVSSSKKEEPERGLPSNTTSQASGGDVQNSAKEGEGRVYTSEGKDKAGTTGALVGGGSDFTSYVHSQTTKGVNIFSFAFTAAKDFASSVFQLAFGVNETNNQS